MKELDKKAFDQSYKYDDYRNRSRKKLNNARRHDNKSETGINKFIKE